MALRDVIEDLKITDKDEIRSFKRAYHYCIWLLSKRDYSRFKLSRKLFEKKYTPHIDPLLDFLTEEKYLREDFYIMSRVKTFMYKGQSKKHIIAKLRQERLDVKQEVVDDIFQEYSFIENEQVNDLINKKIRSKGVEALEDIKFKQKLIRYLLSKGHSYDMINIEINRMIEDKDSNEDDLFN